MKKRIIRYFTMLLTVAVLIVNTDMISAFAVPNVEIDDDVYNLYVDEYPDAVSNGIFSKFKSSKANVDDYYLNLSSEDSDEIFEKALKSAGIKLNDAQLTASFTTTLYLAGEDDDIKKTDSVEVLCPLPDDAQEHPKDCEFYVVSSGKAKPANYTLVIDADEVYYAQFNLPTYGTYGFVYNDPDSYDDEEEDDNDGDDEDDEDDEEDDEDDEDDDYIDDDYDDEDEDEEDPTPTPTPTPTSTPTPTQKPKATPTPTKKPTNTPKPIKDTSQSNNNSSSGNKTQIKDSIPKTGDDFPLAPLTILGGISGISLVTALVLIKKRK